MPRKIGAVLVSNFLIDLLTLKLENGLIRGECGAAAGSLTSCSCQASSADSGTDHRMTEGEPAPEPLSMFSAGLVGLIPSYIS